MIILASQSPRRLELLKYIVDDFKVVPSDIIEEIDLSCGIVAGVEELAMQKAMAVYSSYSNDVVIGADTIVVVNEEILGKPESNEEAFVMLGKLSGQTHYVITGLSIISKEISSTFSVVTEVSFYHLSKSEIMEYVNECSPLDKAGAYAIQDKAALFVKEIKGDYYNVMGLPIAMLNQQLKRFEY